MGFGTFLPTYRRQPRVISLCARCLLYQSSARPGRRMLPRVRGTAIFSAFLSCKICVLSDNRLRSAVPTFLDDLASGHS
jgi:hypothetical protein